MIYTLIGHRGTGKTFLLESLRQYAFQNAIDYDFIDLDKYIETNEGKSIEELFQSKGKKYFRDLELKYFTKICNTKYDSKHKFVAIGAGFEFSLSDFETYNYWIHRDHDNDVRYYTDRPRLYPEISVEQEFKKIFSLRENKYNSAADEFIHCPPLLSWPHDVLSFFFQKENMSHSIFTIFPRHLSKIKILLRNYLKMNIRQFEIRNDLLSTQQIQNLIPLITNEKILVSFRKQDQDLLNLCRSKKLTYDWALELGPPPKQCPILSLHEMSSHDIDIQLQNFNRYENQTSYLKLSPLVKNFSDLQKLHQWSCQSTSRYLLPRSNNKIWQWYRHIQQSKKSFSFLRTDPESVNDQLSSIESLFYKPYSSTFAAVLGSPVDHSLSPSVHRSFFSIPFYPIEVSEEDFSFAVDFLKQLGMSAAAVTSPLKIKAFNISDEVIDPVKLESCNTLVFKNKTTGYNTDINGLNTFKKYTTTSDHIVIWGGGGTLLPLLKTFPEASCFSLREQKARDGFSSQPADIVVWAVSSKQFSKFPHFPPTQWPVRLVLDLNYSSDSPGKYFANLCGATYISGKDMFLSQAKAQTEIWARHGCK